MDMERREAVVREELVKERDEQLNVLMDRLGRSHLEEQKALRDESANLLDKARGEAKKEEAVIAKELEIARDHAISFQERHNALELTVQSLREKLGAEEARIQEVRGRHQSLEYALKDNRDQQTR